MDRSDLAVRMKDFYESVPKTRLMKRTPVTIRLDGKAFHSFTKGFKRPFDECLITAMQQTMKYLCENIQGCVLGYAQSDEITLILVDYQTLDTSAWFDYEVQKLCSISASMATMKFNQVFAEIVDDYLDMHEGEDEAYDWALVRARDKGAMFDARCFNIPKEEVTNLVYWRQLDASRNSVQMVGQANFSHAELQNKTCNMIRDMLMTQKDINWNDFPAHQKRGSCCIKEKYLPYNIDPSHADDVIDAADFRTRWIIDTEIPMFRGEGRNYIEKLINFE